MAEISESENPHLAAYADRFAYVAGGVQAVAVSPDEIVVLGIPPESDDEATGHNCDAMGCGQDHVLLRGKRAPADAAMARVLEAARVLYAERDGLVVPLPERVRYALRELYDAVEGVTPAPAPEGAPVALHAAVAAIYFDDSADHIRAPWSVVRALDPEVAELLEDDEETAYWVTSSEAPDDDVPATTVEKVRAFRAHRTPALTPPDISGHADMSANVREAPPAGDAVTWERAKLINNVLTAGRAGGFVFVRARGEDDNAAGRREAGAVSELLRMVNALAAQAREADRCKRMECDGWQSASGMSHDLTCAVEARDAWRDYAEHAAGCVECGQTSWENCHEGGELRATAEKADKLIDPGHGAESSRLREARASTVATLRARVVELEGELERAADDWAWVEAAQVSLLPVLGGSGAFVGWSCGHVGINRRIVRGAPLAAVRATREHLTARAAAGGEA